MPDGSHPPRPDKRPKPLEECAKCRFWLGRAPDEKRPSVEDYGECRRRAPVALMHAALRVALYDIEDPEEREVQAEAVWPLTHFEQWCGEFAFKEEAPDGID